ncbi:MAG: 16S rRNA (uracil(1498)-N(3))-methyltransferase [Acetobacteraceae bacterium]|nr:16S rRNA (uracil(1498)-N(3))-methyltransferase [Acetobacteraceae bacterium]
MTWSTGNTTTPRLFVTSPLLAGAEIATSAEQAHYLGTVLRRATGDPVRLFNGSDGEWIATSTESRVTRRGITLTVRERTRAQAPEAGPWLVFALLKRDATDLVVRQAVELGASRLLPVITERTNAARVNEGRLRAIALEAAEQSERLTIPTITGPQRLDSLLTAWPEGRRLFAAFERSDARAPEPGHEDAALLIGPEGGFTPAEREMLRRLNFVHPVSLGPFVLRAETAAAAGLALLLAMGWAEYVGST